MKIAIFTETYEPYISGVVTSIKMLKDALEEMHHTVYIVTANLENNTFTYNEEEKIIYLPGIKTGIYETKLTSIYSRKAMKIIQSWQLNIIHSQTEFGVGIFSRIVAKKLGIPIVHTYHTLYEDYLHYVTKGHFNNLSHKMVVKLTKYFCEKSCDEVIVPSSKIASLFQKYHITKNVHVIPTGIDTKKFLLKAKAQKTLQNLKEKYHLKNTDFVIGSVGRIAKEKSLDKLLTSFQILLKENPNFKLIVVGDGPELNNLKALAKTLKIKQKVIFTGKVPYENIAIYYHLFQVMVSFSITETQGLTIIEGLASSLPILCINDDSFKDMVENNYNGYLFNNEQEFIKNILYLKNNPKKYQELSLNAQNSIYKFSKEVFASEVLKVYYQAIEKVH